MEVTLPNADIQILPETPANDIPEEVINPDLVFLDPQRVRLFRTGGANVRATIDDPGLGVERSYLRVQIARAFPLSKPDTYIGLRDGADKDVGMLVTLNGMDKESQALVAEELERRYFLPVVSRVLQLKEDFGNYTFEVETNRGTRKFIVQNIRDSVQELSPGRVFVTDKDGLRYEIPDVSRLAPKHYAVFQRVL